MHMKPWLAIAAGLFLLSMLAGFMLGAATMGRREEAPEYVEEMGEFHHYLKEMHDWEPGK